MVVGPHGESAGPALEACHMAFLSSFRIGQQTVYPDELLRKAALASRCLDNVGDGALKKSAQPRPTGSRLPGGTLLERDGENDAALFLVVTGCLGVFVADSARAAPAWCRMAPAGETVGEMSLIMPAARDHIPPSWWRCATASLLRISVRDGFRNPHRSSHPRVLMNLMQHDGASASEGSDARHAMPARPGPRPSRSCPCRSILAKRLHRPSSGAGALTEMGIARRGAGRSIASRTRLPNGSTLSRRRMMSSSTAAMRPTVAWNAALPASGRPYFPTGARRPAAAAARRWTFPPSRSALQRPAGIAAAASCPAIKRRACPQHFSLRTGLFEIPSSYPRRPCRQ